MQRVSTMTAPALPGDIPGLLRKGSPIPDGVVLEVVADRAWVTDNAPGEWQPAARVPLRFLSLDLTDETGRAHASSWVGGVGAVAGRLSRHPSAPASGELSLSVGRMWFVSRAVGRHRKEQIVVPTLATLDRNDSRTLPDGSRWVDAEALRLVCAHLASERASDPSASTTRR